MPSRSLVRALLLLYLVTGVIITYVSLLTVWQAARGELRHADQMHGLILGSFETVAAILFLIPKFMRWGAAGLLIVFLIAFALHAAQGSPHWDLLIYATVVYFIREHGIHSHYFQLARAGAD